MDNLEQILEGLLFVSGDGLEKGYIMEKLSVLDKDLDKAIEKLKAKYSGKSGIHLICYKDKIQLCSNPDYADDISVVLNPIRERNLSKSTLEVIAIVCYKQPITRLEIEEIRKVNSDYAIQTLLNHGLIEVVGRKDAVGKPLLFGTTDEFLKRFQIENLSQLPDYEEILKQVELIESDGNLYNEFEIKDEEEEVLINGEVVKNKSKTLQELNGEIIRERREQNKKDDMLLEDLVASQKALEALNKKLVETTLNPKPVQEEAMQKDNLVTSEENKTNSVEVVDERIEDKLNKEEEIPDFLKNEKNIEIVG